MPTRTASEAAAAFARDGYCVVRGVIDQDTIDALRLDADARSAGQDLEQDSTVWVHDMQDLPLRAPARTQASAYLEMRARGGQACPLIAEALLRTLPWVASIATGWEGGCLRLFNEHYVIKPPGGGQHFLWHRDADRHLRCAERVASQPRRAAQQRAAAEEGEEPVEGHYYAGAPPAAAVSYVNTWAPLDACTADNGTLCVLPASTPGHRDSGAPAARPCSLAACEEEHGVRMALQPGDVCVFASYVFHTSRPNEAPAARRVHYASWSLGAVCWAHDACKELVRAMARRPTAVVPSRRYELLSALQSPRHNADTLPSPPLMFAVPVLPKRAGESGPRAGLKRKRAHEV